MNEQRKDRTFLSRTASGNSSADSPAFRAKLCVSTRSSATSSRPLLVFFAQTTPPCRLTPPPTATRKKFIRIQGSSGAVDNGVRFYAQPTCHHAPEVYSGINEVQSAEMLRRFFSQKRETP